MASTYNIFQRAYANGKEFIQDHKYQLVAGTAGISAIAIAALAIYSGRFSLPQSQTGKTAFILASSGLGGTVGALTGGVYLASKTDTTGSEAGTCVEGMFRLIGGALAGGAVGVVIAAVASNILLNR